MSLFDEDRAITEQSMKRTECVSDDVSKDRCVRCGLARDKHKVTNYADGGRIGVTILICPTSTFALREQEA